MLLLLFGVSLFTIVANFGKEQLTNTFILLGQVGFVTEMLLWTEVLAGNALLGNGLTRGLLYVGIVVLIGAKVGFHFVMK